MKQFLLLILALLLQTAGMQVATAQEVTKQTLTLLPMMDEGPWPCAYYLLDSNEELDQLEVKAWAGRCADERDWVQGWGPFSSEQDSFLRTHWGSPRQALLVRRHFTLTAEQVEAVHNGSVTFRCSYDENPKAYINGTYFWGVSGWNDNAYATTKLTRRHRQLLREGDNVIAVSLPSGGGSGHLDLELTATITVTPDGVAVPMMDDEEDAQSVYKLDGTIVDARSHRSKGIYIQKRKKKLKK